MLLCLFCGVAAKTRATGAFPRSKPDCGRTQFQPRLRLFADPGAWVNRQCLSLAAVNPSEPALPCRLNSITDEPPSWMRPEHEERRAAVSSIFFARIDEYPEVQAERRTRQLLDGSSRG
jgi:hypothetical protein